MRSIVSRFLAMFFLSLFVLGFCEARTSAVQSKKRVYICAPCGCNLHDAKFLHRESLVALEKKLDPSVFVRIHRSFIVNLDRVKKILPTPYGDHIVVLDKGTKLKLSRAKRHLLEQRI